MFDGMYYIELYRTLKSLGIDQEQAWVIALNWKLAWSYVALLLPLIPVLALYFMARHTAIALTAFMGVISFAGMAGFMSSAIYLRWVSPEIKSWVLSWPNLDWNGSALGDFPGWLWIPWLVFIPICWTAHVLGKRSAN